MIAAATETASYVRLLNGYYSRPDYFRADVALGTLRTAAGSRLCVLTDDFLRGFRTAVRFECGKATDRVFKKCGIRWGTSFVQRFDRELTDHYGVPARDVSAGLMLHALGEAFRYHGWGKLAVDLAHYDAGVVSLTLTDGVLAEVSERADKPADALFAGFFAGLFRFYAGTDLDCVQTDCPTRGADASRFLVGLPERLAEVPKWVADKLPHAVVVRRLTAAVAEGELS
jgi:hypothetical protein